MIGVLDVIDRLPLELAQRLEADPFFDDIPVIVAEEGDVLAELARAQAIVTTKSGKRGVAVIVLQVVGDDVYPNVAFGPMALRPAFQVIENVELNRDAAGTGKSARRVARMIRDLVKPLCLAGLTTEFIPDNPCIEPVNLGAGAPASLKAYQVNFVTYEADTQGVEQVSTPLFVPAGMQFTITCATAGAEIWYTVDDSYPRPPTAGDTAAGRPNTSVLFTGPVDVPVEGLTVRAGAFKAGCIGSQIARASITRS